MQRLFLIDKTIKYNVNAMGVEFTLTAKIIKLYELKVDRVFREKIKDSCVQHEFH